MTKAKDRILVSRQCNIRFYTYTATLSAKTGKLLHIEAGCRRWKTFDEARRHYNGVKKGTEPHWADDAEVNVRAQRGDYDLFAMRWEARRLLEKLFYDVSRHQGLIRKRNARRRARK